MNLDLRARSIKGGVASATLLGSTGPQMRRARSAAKEAGLRYERQVGRALEKLHTGHVHPAEWWAFDDDNGSGRCQTDLRLSVVDWGYGAYQNVIVEVKSYHSLSAWHQLRNLYAPVVTKALGAPPLLLEICRSHDPAVHWPERYELFHAWETFEQWARRLNPERGPHMAVLTWKPGR